MTPRIRITTQTDRWIADGVVRIVCDGRFWIFLRFDGLAFDFPASTVTEIEAI
jgi:hypothetical protein